MTLCARYFSNAVRQVFAELFENGAASWLISLLKKYASDKVILELCLRAINNLAFYMEDPAAVELVKQEALLWIQQTMKHNLDDTSIQVAGCSAIQNICTSIAEHKDAAANLGIVDTVVEVMRLYPAEPSVQASCDWTLSVLCASHVKNSHQVSKLGGVELSIRAMNAFPEIDEVQAAACCLMTNLIQSDASKYQRELTKAGAIEATLQALRAHPANSRVQFQGCTALGHLVGENIPNQTKTFELNGLELVLRAARTNRADELVQYSVCRALRNLSDDIKHHLMLAKEGAITVIKNALHKFPSTEVSQDAGMFLVKLKWQMCT